MKRERRAAVVIWCINSLQRHVDSTHSTHNERGNVHSHTDAVTLWEAQACTNNTHLAISTVNSHSLVSAHYFLTLLPSCPSPLNEIKHTLSQLLQHKSNVYLCTAATPSSAWNRGGCSHTPRGYVPVPGVVGWQAAQTLPSPNHEACYPLETATYEIVRITVFYCFSKSYLFLS